MNEPFLQPIKHDHHHKSVGDNPHLQHLEMLVTNQVNQVNASLKSISASNLLNQNLTSNSSNSISSIGNSIIKKEEDKKLKNSLAIEETSNLLNDQFISSKTANSIALNSHLATNNLTANSLINSSLNSPKLQSNHLTNFDHHPFLNSSTNRLTPDGVSIPSHSDYYTNQYSDDNQLNAIDLNHDYLLKNNYCHQLSPTSNCIEPTYHNLTSNQITSYNSQVNSNSFLNNFNSIGSINPSSLDSGYDFLHFSNSLINYADNIVNQSIMCENTMCKNSINLNSSLNSSSLPATTDCFRTFHTLEPSLNAQNNNANQLDTTANQLNQSINLNNLTNNNLSNTNSILNSQFTPEQIRCMIWNIS